MLFERDAVHLPVQKSKPSETAFGYLAVPKLLTDLFVQDKTISSYNINSMKDNQGHNDIII